jgi:hypothetical protein
MIRRLASPALLAAALMGVASPARAGCEPARPGPHVAAQPAPWRHAVEALLQSTAGGDLPWSCVGGEVDLVADEAGARLTVTDAEGHTVTREVALPEEVQPLGEALLAQPLPPAAIPASEEPIRPPSLGDPRLLVALSLGPRYAGGTHAMWGGLTAAATLPFGKWGAGLWLRGDVLSGPLGEPHPPIRDVAFGAAASRSFDAGPLELRADLRPSLVLMRRDMGHGKDAELRLSGRLGAAFTAVLPLSKRFRGFLALDGEVAPFELAMREPAPSPDQHEAVPARYPGFTIGLGLGVEVAIR